MDENHKFRNENILLIIWLVDSRYLFKPCYSLTCLLWVVPRIPFILVYRVEFEVDNFLVDFYVDLLKMILRWNGYNSTVFKHFSLSVLYTTKTASQQLLRCRDVAIMGMPNNICGELGRRGSFLYHSQK